MAKYGSFMYRRNGRYYARLRIPSQYQAVYGRTHLRKSLDTSDLAVARVRLHEVVLRWRREFERLKTMLDADRVLAGSPLLVGDGLISVGSASRESGIPVADIVQEAINRRFLVYVQAEGWQGSEISVFDLEFEHLGPLEEGTYSPSILVLNSADGAPVSPVVGTLLVADQDLALASGNTVFQTSLLYRPGHSRAVVFRQPISVPKEQLLIHKTDAERLRVELSTKITPEMVAAARAARHAAASMSAPRHKYSAMKSSELLDKFFKAKESNWSHATKMDMNTMCGAFVDLMDDPALGDIDGNMVLHYRSMLARVPWHVGIARRRAGVKTFTELLDAVPDMRRMGGERINEYVGKLSEFLGWGTQHGFLERNPATGAMKKTKKARREQDERQPISAENLAKIFSVSWFKSGRGDRTAKGRHWSFQPSHYWLPLLGLFVGGRLNELSQLYLDDLKQTPSGQWYIDFNLEQPDKRDADDPDDVVIGEKRFKTVNAVRVVPLHSRLVELGLPQYVAALRATGRYERLFPELLWNETKGYSKQSSRWFNELFMGRKLNIARDGSQVFHSLRHNFITALDQADVPERIIAQLAGHQRGETMSGKRYAKDREADDLAPYIERLAYTLPPIAAFDVADGLVALEHALDRKQDAAKRRPRATAAAPAKSSEAAH
jgi:hypothetical protein